MDMTRVRSQIPVRDEDRGPGDDNARIWCHWPECDNPGSALHFIIECHAAAAVRLGNRAGPPGYNSYGAHGELPPRRMCTECRALTFCSEQCRAYYARSHRTEHYGKLPPGINPRYFLT
jgi:hypothetical protein